MTDLPLLGRVALVAGASRGIGAATAEAFADASAARQTPVSGKTLKSGTSSL